MTTFYISNVEQHIERSELFERFYGNVATLPIHNASTFIRAVTSVSEKKFGIEVPDRTTFFRSTLAPIEDSLKAFNKGGFTCREAIEMSK